MHNELYLVSVDAKYLKFLHSKDYRVSVKYNNRPFVGVITMINGINYVLPLTSTTTEKRVLQGKKKRASKITTFVRDSSGEEIADILHNNMIPVLDSVYKICNIDASQDDNSYEANEIRYIRKNKERIIAKAKKVHDDRILKNEWFLDKTCCDFKKLEEEYKNFKI